MISYYYYWKALNSTEESLKTVLALQPDVPPMVEAQHEMNELALQYWRKKSEKFTKRFLLTLIFCVILATLLKRMYS